MLAVAASADEKARPAIVKTASSSPHQDVTKSRIENRFYATDDSLRSSTDRRAWRLIRRHLIGEPRLMRVLELHFLGVVDPRVIGAALGVSKERAISLSRDLLLRLNTIRRALESAHKVRARMNALPWQQPKR